MRKRLEATPVAVLWLAIGLAFTMLLVLVLVDPAWAAAQGDANQYGANLGKLLVGWAGAAFGGIAACFGLVYLMGRRAAELGSFILMAIVVGGFVFAHKAIGDGIVAIWNAIVGA